MKLAALALSAIALFLGGCANGTWKAKQAYSPAASNAEAFDTYVNRRSSELASAGKYSASEAATIAENEAARRYGPRTSTDSYTAGWTWTDGSRTREVSLAELDKTMAGMKQR